MIFIIVIAAIIIATFGFVVMVGAPYVPTKRGELKTALTKLYKLGKDDTLVDMGSGGGIVLRESALLGARAVGYEVNPILVLISKILSRSEPDVSTLLANVWRVRFPETTTVVYVFGESRDIKRITAKIEQEATRLKKDLMVISYGFTLPAKTPLKKVGAHFLYKISPLPGQ